GIVIYGCLNAVLASLVRLFGVFVVKANGFRIFPWQKTDAATVRKIAGTGGWNLAIGTAMNLHIRADALLMNIFFSLEGNAIFGLAVYVSAMVKQISGGMVDGLEAVSTRVSSKDNEGSLKRLVSRTGRQTAMVVFPAIIGVVVLFDPLVHVWLGSHLGELQSTEQLLIIGAVLLVGYGARAISDGWRLVFYGAGYIRSYAPILLAGGLANPIIGVMLIFMLPDSVSWVGPAAAFAVTMLMFNGIGMVLKSERASGLRQGHSYLSLLRPLFAAILATPAILVASFFDLDHLSRILLSAIPFVLLYGLLAWAIVLDARERAMILAIPRKIIAFRRKGASSGTTL
ncbi:MAG: oligosaccharide flippase family protein, partial [Planctomycetota bacterium]